MPWRGRQAKICRSCGGHVSQVGPLSARYKCQLCGIGRMAVNATQLHEHSGPSFERWRRALAASVGGVLLDEIAEQD